jgi:anti-anti-sigma regulatory factor
MPLEITHSEVTPGKVVIALTGKIMMGRESEPIVPLVEDLLHQGKRTVIFDLSAVGAIDSTGIGRFIASYNKIVAAGGRRMAGATGHIFQSFHISLLDQIFPFCQRRRRHQRKGARALHSSHRIATVRERSGWASSAWPQSLNPATHFASSLVMTRRKLLLLVPRNVRGGVAVPASSSPAGWTTPLSASASPRARTLVRQPAWCTLPTCMPPSSFPCR